MVIQDLIESWHNNAATKTVVVIDLETGGLNDTTHKTDSKIPPPLIGAQFYPILEITARFFDGNLVEVREPMTFVIHHELADLHEKCSQWSIDKFANNLFIECSESNLSLKDAESLVTERVKEIGNEEAYILGNSVGLDKSFIAHQMDDLHEALHYRVIDVSAMKTLFGFMFGENAKYKKSEVHRTEQDVEETLGELRFYLSNFIKSRESVARQFI